MPRERRPLELAGKTAGIVGARPHETSERKRETIITTNSGVKLDTARIERAFSGDAL
jgi:hypothetical protein